CPGSCPLLAAISTRPGAAPNIAIALAKPRTGQSASPPGLAVRAREPIVSIDKQSATKPPSRPHSRVDGPKTHPYLEFSAHQHIGRPRRSGAFRQRACKPDPVLSGHLSRRGRNPDGAPKRPATY